MSGSGEIEPPPEILEKWLKQATEIWDNRHAKLRQEAGEGGE